MRVSVQLRASAEQGSGRWRKAVFLDETAASSRCRFLSSVRPRAVWLLRPPLDSIASVMFVIDTLNTALGTNGEFWIDDVAFVR
jgi:hypothetical protein